MALRSQLFKSLSQGAGSVFTIKKTITSSGITTSAQDLTTVANRGELMIEQIIVKTDATGLAGGTNFTILSNNANGVVNIFVETIANLGANITKTLFGTTAADTTTSDSAPTVTSLTTVLEAGKKLQYLNTAAAGTGEGTIDIYVSFRRLSDGANCTAA